jgi:hypothetical protein
MKRFSEQLQKQANIVRLSASERAVLRERVVSYMEYHPLPERTVAPQPTVAKVLGTRFEPFMTLTPSPYFWRFATATVALVFVVGLPLLAERSVPGDVLYAMKVNVNEEVRSSLVRSGYEKVAWETERLERRIAEARILAKEGKLTSDVEAAVVAAVATHAQAAEAEIESLRTSDVDAAGLAQLTLTSVLDVQSASLLADTTGSTTMGMSTVALAQVLETTSRQTAGQATLPISQERLMAQLEVETTRGRELLTSISDGVTEQESKDIERRLSDIEGKVARAMKTYASDQPAGTTELRAVWRDMQTLITFMTDIDVRLALELETLVPLIPTNDERRVLVYRDYNEAEAALSRIIAGVDAIEDANVVEKINLTIPLVQTLLETATTSLAADNIDVAEGSAKEARAYTDSMITMATFPALIDLPTATSTPVIDIPVATSTDSVATSSNETETETELEIDEEVN